MGKATVQATLDFLEPFLTEMLPKMEHTDAIGFLFYTEEYPPIKVKNDSGEESERIPLVPLVAVTLVGDDIPDGCTSVQLVAEGVLDDDIGYIIDNYEWRCAD